MSEARIQRRLAAIFSADVAGYSRLMGADEEGARRRVRACQEEVIDPALARFGGRVFKTVGDGVLAEFASVVEAVRCAVEIQRRLAAVDGLRYRIGINLGDVLVEGSDIHGDGVNIAKRIEGLAEPGGICISGGVHDETAGKLAVGFEEVAAPRLKNIVRQVRVYRVVLDPRDVPRRLRAAVLAVGGAIVLGGAVGAYLALRPPAPMPVRTAAAPETAAPAPASAPARAAPGAAGEAPRLSIAVLPFANLDADPGQDYVVDAITEDLITDLSAIPGSFVIARTTSFTYKGVAVDVKQIGRELGVRYVLEGSVRRREDQMRLTVQLIDAESGAHVWAERFDRERADWPALQDEIIGRIARAVDIELVDAESRRSARASDPGASDLAMRGWSAINRPQSRESNAEALALFEAALARDGAEVDALVGSAFTRMRNVLNGWSDTPLPELQSAEQAVGLALSLDPRHATAHMVRGIVLRAQRQLDASAEAFRAALALNPNLAPALAQLGVVERQLGRVEAALAAFHKAIRLSPRDPNLGIWLMFVGDTLLLQGRDAEALDWLKKAVSENPRFGIAHGILAAALALGGRDAEARAAFAEFRRLVPNMSAARLAAEDHMTDPALIARRQVMIEALRRLEEGG